MKTKGVQSHIITAAGLAPPIFDLPGRHSEVFKAFYLFLENDFPLDLSGMEVIGGNKYSDLKVVLDVNGGKYHCELTPAVMLNHFRHTGVDELARITKFGRLYEEAVRRAFNEVVITDRVYRLHSWLDVVEGGKETASRWLQDLGGKSVGLKGPAFKDFDKDFTFRADLRGKQENVSITVQKSAIGVGDLYIELAVQLYAGAKLDDLDANYKMLLKRYSELKQELGLDG
jgi:hypothetical protein